MKKILIIGCPGSGKSTFSKKLHSITKIPLYHLDMIYWKEDKTIIPKNIFLEQLSNILKKNEWIIDGNYSSTMELRIQKCDTIIFLDYPTDVCLQGIKERLGKKRTDIPWAETEEDLEFIEFIKTYNLKQKPQVIELLKTYNDKNIFIFNNRKEADEFLNNI